LSALSNLAAHYVETGKSVEAVKLIRKALNINPNNSEAHFWLGYIFRYTGPLDKSIEEMETAVKLDPLNSKFRSIGVTYFYLERFEESLKGLSDVESTFSKAWKGFVFKRTKDLGEYLKKLH
jgi:tetratricopeptide (TPR) repeat protein